MGYSEGEKRIRLKYRKLSKQQEIDIKEIKKRSAELIDLIIWSGKDKRLVELAMTAIEEGAMWAVKSVSSE